MRAIGIAFAALLVFAGEAGAGSLCVDGHPAPRRANVTYGGLPVRYGYERDHIIPLCLGGADERSNVQYQPWPEARAKDEREWRACEAYCRGEVSLEVARRQFQ